MRNEKLITILSETLEKPIHEVNEIARNELLSEYGMDSLNFIRFIVLIEEEFGVSVDDNDLLMDHFGTIQKIHETMEKYLKNGNENDDAATI